MGLAVTFGNVCNRHDVSIIEQPNVWRVSVVQIDRCAIGGFASERDADMAKRTMQSLPINWDGTVEEIQSDIERFGGQLRFRMAALEHLQW